MRCGGDGGDGRGEGRMEGCEDGRKTVDEEFNVRLVRLFDTHTTIPLPLPPQTDPESGIRRRFIADRRIFRSCGPVDFSVTLFHSIRVLSLILYFVSLYSKFEDWKFARRVYSIVEYR